MNPQLLSRLNLLGRQMGEIVTLTSGFRTHEEQRRLYYSLKAQDPNAVVAKPGTSNHEGGQAVDALVDNQPIASVIDEATLNAIGLKSLASINDPVHVELTEPGSYNPPSGGAQPVVFEPAVEGAPPPMVPAGSVSEAAPTGPGFDATPDVILPFDTNPDEQPTFLDPQQRAETWQLIAQLPGASPETQQLARMMMIGR